MVTSADTISLGRDSHDTFYTSLTWRREYVAMHRPFCKLLIGREGKGWHLLFKRPSPRS